MLAKSDLKARHRSAESNRVGWSGERGGGGVTNRYKLYLACALISLASIQLYEEKIEAYTHGHLCSCTGTISALIP